MLSNGEMERWRDGEMERWRDGIFLPLKNFLTAVLLFMFLFLDS